MFYIIQLGTMGQCPMWRYNRKIRKRQIQFEVKWPDKRLTIPAGLEPGTFCTSWVCSLSVARPTESPYPTPVSHDGLISDKLNPHVKCLDSP